MDYGGTGGDNKPFPYPDAGDDGRSGSYSGDFADVEVAAEGCVGGYMYIIAEFTFTVNGDTCIHNAVLSDFYIALDYRTLHHNRAFAERGHLAKR